MICDVTMILEELKREGCDVRRERKFNTVFWERTKISCGVRNVARTHKGNEYNKTVRGRGVDILTRGLGCCVVYHSTIYLSNCYSIHHSIMSHSSVFSFFFSPSPLDT